MIISKIQSDPKFLPKTYLNTFRPLWNIIRDVSDRLKYHNIYSIRQCCIYKWWFYYIIGVELHYVVSKWYLIRTFENRRVFVSHMRQHHSSCCVYYWLCTLPLKRVKYSCYSPGYGKTVPQAATYDLVCARQIYGYFALLWNYDDFKSKRNNVLIIWVTKIKSVMVYIT